MPRPPIGEFRERPFRVIEKEVERPEVGAILRPPALPCEQLRRAIAAPPTTNW